MYIVIMILSVLMRTFYLPNPFEVFGNNIMIPFGDYYFPIPANFINILYGSLVLAPIAFAVTGRYYHKGIDHPAKGSCIFLGFYMIYNYMTVLASRAQFEDLAIVVIIVAYFVLHICIDKIINRFMYNKLIV